MTTKLSAHPQLTGIKERLDDASQKAASIVDSLEVCSNRQRPQPNKWSIAECLVHLNLSSKAGIEEIDRALEQSRHLQTSAVRPFKMDLLGRILKWTLEPPPKFLSRMKTTKQFQPVETESVGDALKTFLELQEQLKGG